MRGICIGVGTINRETDKVSERLTSRLKRNEPPLRSRNNGTIRRLIDKLVLDGDEHFRGRCSRLINAIAIQIGEDDPAAAPSSIRCWDTICRCTGRCRGARVSAPANSDWNASFYSLATRKQQRAMQGASVAGNLRGPDQTSERGNTVRRNNDDNCDHGQKLNQRKAVVFSQVNREI